MRPRTSWLVALAITLGAAASAACTAILDLEEPPPGAADAGHVSDASRADRAIKDAATKDGAIGSPTDGGPTDATIADADATAIEGGAHDATLGDGDALTLEAGSRDGTSDARTTETGVDAVATADAPVPLPDGQALLQGTVSGLPAGGSVTIVDNGGNSLTVQGAGDGGASVPFAFTMPLVDGAPYAVTVSAQPSNGLCTVASGSGTVPGSPIEVQCGAVVAVAAGFVSTCAIVAGGTVDCWGDNTHGELGIGTFTNSLPDVPVQVSSLFHVTQVALGLAHACALQAGVVYCWGYNNAGQLGNGSTTSSSTPTKVSLPATSTAIAITAGYAHSCALLANGTVECWGDNTSGDLGNGQTTASSSPVVVSGVGGAGTLTNVVAVDAGTNHTCALLANGTIACWGQNANAQLGNGTTVSSSVPVLTSVGSAVAVSAGNFHTCAVVGGGDGGSAGGSVTCWGLDTSGQTSAASLSGAASPSLVSLSGPATDLTGGSSFTCARLLSGAVECWGFGIYGQLGNPTLPTVQATPSAIASLGGVVSVAAGDQHACAVLASGGLECWGANAYGQLANVPPAYPAPTSVNGLAGALGMALAGTALHACAVSLGGSVQCWGSDVDDQLGNPNELASNAPVAVAGVTGATAVSVGTDHTCAIVGNSGMVACWGLDTSGQLGNGAQAGATPTPTLVPGFAGAVALANGANFTCALLSNGTVECWGNNGQGELGDGLVKNSATPTSVLGIAGATAITAGQEHACALVGGHVDCWGYDNEGQLGTPVDGGMATSFVVVPGVSGAVAITAGNAHTCALLSSGGVDCWGFNGSGQVGNGSTTSPIASATPVLGLTGAATQVAAGAAHTCAVIAGGTVECWGANSMGQLATDGGVAYGKITTTAVPVPGVTGAVAVYAGQNLTCARLTGGAVTCWGWNAYGQLGTGQPSQSSAPVPVQ